MRLTRRAVLVANVLLLGASLKADEVYVVRFDTLRIASVVEQPCTYLAWRDELVFHNSSNAVETVRLISVSDGEVPVAQDLGIEPGNTITSEGSDGAVISTWAPTPLPLLWVAHLDVPDSVVMRSRILAETIRRCGDGGIGNLRVYAGLALPMVRSLTPAGVRRIHLASDIGGPYNGPADDGRINVGVYNGGEGIASATIEVRRACDETLVDLSSIAIPPNSIVQVGGLSASFDGCTATHSAGFESYVVVTVDQPSLSYAITLSNQRPPYFPGTSSP